MTEPIFEIIDGDKHYKIYEDGRIEGFSKDVVVFNRVPMRVLTLKEFSQAKIN